MKWKPLLISFGIIAFLWITFLSSSTQPLWKTLDLIIFKTLNGTLEGNKFLQYFWACINHKRMDLVEDVVFLIFFIWGVKSAPKELRWKRTVQFLSLTLLAASIIFFINRKLLYQHPFVLRESPTLVVTPCVRITEVVPWKGVKDEALSSFPGDHATTLLLFGFIFSTFVPRRLAIPAWIYVVFRTLPRLIVGAHWFSDIAVGSISISLFFSACFLYTPLGTVVINKLEKFRPRKANNDIQKDSL
jgi:membrane-associated phospholipid phosphatase